MTIFQAIKQYGLVSWHVLTCMFDVTEVHMHDVWCMPCCPCYRTLDTRRGRRRLCPLEDQRFGSRHTLLGKHFALYSSG